jgi:methylenetetrahydrofolate reductase (NADPH)
VKSLIHQFLDEGINHFLALRGDLPPGHSQHSGELLHAEHLVELMARGLADSPSIERIAVAAFPNGHPESTTLDQDIEVLLRKQQAGANVAITQLFFYVEHYLAFVDKARRAGVTIPLLPGLMPVTSASRLRRILELTGENSPRELESALNGAATTEEQHSIGISWCASMIRELVDEGAPGIHLYAFNQHETVLSALEEAGVR